MTPDKKWLSGGYPINDHEIEVPDPKEIKPHIHNDMSAFGTWLDYTGFNESASEDDKKGIDFQKYCLDCYTILDYRVK